MASHWTERRVVVTGLGAVSPLGNDIPSLWANLVAGQCGIQRITLFDPAEFDTQIAAEVKNFDGSSAFPSPKEARRSDRFAQFAISAGRQALRLCVPGTVPGPGEGVEPTVGTDDFAKPRMLFHPVL